MANPRDTERCGLLPQGLQFTWGMEMLLGCYAGVIFKATEKQIFKWCGFVKAEVP